MSEEQIRAACEAANCKYPDMEIMAEFKREVTPAVVIGLLDGLRHAKGIAAINDARANGAAETIHHLRSDNTDLRARLAKYEDAEGNPISTMAEQAREVLTGAMRSLEELAFAGELELSCQKGVVISCACNDCMTDRAIRVHAKIRAMLAAVPSAGSQGGDV